MIKKTEAKWILRFAFSPSYVGEYRGKVVNSQKDKAMTFDTKKQAQEYKSQRLPFQSVVFEQI